jgi:D-beta-D-heptose 7-phosphate kinase/D-beta-D-heptose 1-phosphate adenosyltransferase
MKIVLVTGGFDPLHSGHIAYFEAARQLGDMLIVGINTDEWLVRKKGKSFMDEYERLRIIESLKVVDKVVCYPDADNSSKNTITGVRAMYPDATIIFANGGDRTKENIPEMDLVDDKLEFLFGVGGEHKANSSSWILEEWKAPKTERPWGYYRVLYEIPGMKVKELTVNPGHKLSMQRHAFRNEHWIVSKGQCVVKSDNGSLKELAYHDTIDIPVSHWHQLINPYDVSCQIVEIQYGENCIEEDIERKIE